MNPYPPAALAVVLAYLIGALPFGYLTARWVRGIDIRTVGSGNIGATNVGRVLGFRFFLVVFVLDLLKGFLPTYWFPLAVASLAGRGVEGLGVAVALATILGHNFPVYLKFRGGKGVATSLGALLALDWVASVSAAAGFVVFLTVTRYVSLSSLLGGLVFLAVHFVRVDNPWERGQRAMSIATVGLLALLFVRHRKNLARIGAGTEPKVSLRRKPSPPAGFVAWPLIVVLVLAAVVAAYGLSVQARRRSTLAVGEYAITEVARAGTGHQRAERVEFARDGTLLAVTCPRYDRLMLYRVTGRMELEEVRDIALEGRPMAVRATRDRLFVLARPSGDARHVEPGWWQSFDLEGRPIGARATAGMYPDDLAVTPDARHLVILTSGRAEGDPGRPAPALDVIDLAATPPRVVGRLEFGGKGDDPCRITLSATGQCAAVTLLGSEQVAAVDLADRAHPRLIGRSDLAPAAGPQLSTTTGDAILTAVAPERDAVVVLWPGATTPPIACLASTRPRDSSLTFHDPSTGRVLGRLPLRCGALNLSVSRPMGLAHSPERGLLAVASRSGTVHLIAVARPSRHLGIANAAPPVRLARGR